MLPDRSTWASLPTTQADAKAIHSPHFFTGRPCGRGHIFLRKTSSGGCIRCDLDAQYARRRDYHHAYRKAVTREGRRAEDLRKRFTPPWQNPEGAASVKAFYTNRPEGMVVDHRVPFVHDEALVVGLHVLANLAYVRPGANVAKGGALRITRRQAASLVKAGLAIWRSDVSEDFRTVDWDAVLKHRAEL